MQTDQIITLFDYHWSTTERMLELAGQVSDEIYHQELDYGRGSIHKLLYHLIAADHGWRNALETGVQSWGLKAEDFQDRSAIGELLAEERRAWDKYLGQLNDDQLNTEVTLMSVRKKEHRFPLWHILIHLILHGMQHHSELAQMLSNNDQSPGDIDFIFYSA